MQTLFDAEAGATGTSATVTTSRGDRANWRPAQAVISATATVTLQGSLNGTDWVDVKEFTASGGDVVALWPHMRATLADNTGTVTLMVDVL